MTLTSLWCIYTITVMATKPNVYTSMLFTHSHTEVYITFITKQLTEEARIVNGYKIQVFKIKTANTL